MAGIDFDQRKDFQFFESDYRLPSRSFHRDGHTRTEPVKQEKLPHIVVKDVTGRRLDTFTHLQEAIYRARQNIKQTKQALTSDEWRLPHAPPPARPDYSRAAPPLAKFRDRLKGDINQLSRTTKTTATKIFEVDVDDVAFVQQSIRNLPNIPSLSFLRQEILAEPKNYFQIVNTILLHKRFMKQTDKRDAIYNFPGFCTGCRRAGLCYGCEQSSMPHYHADKMMKTGGGFTYYKKYKPEHQIPGRHPLNWKIQFPELALKSVMEDHDKEDLGLLGEDIEHDENCLLKAMLENNVSLPQINKDSLRTTGSSTSRESEEKNEDEGIVADGRSLDDKLSKKDHRSARMSGTSGQGSDQSGEGSYGYDNSQNGYVQVVPHPRIVDLRQQENDEDQLSFDENFIKESMDRASNGTRENEEQCRNEDTEGEGMDTDNGEEYDANQEMYSEDEDKNGDNDSRSRSRTRSNKSSDKHGRQILTGSTRNKDDYKDGDGSVVTKSSSPSSRKYNRLYQGKAYSPEGSGSPTSRRRLYKDDSSGDELYTTPPAFKIKKSERRKVKTSSPFSSNRDYNLNLNKKFELKKSDRKGTEFREFQQHRGDWKAPPKFELKDNQREDMKFWKAPQKKDQGNKKRSRSRKTEHVSPDSGLDSEKLAEMQRQGSGMTRVSLFTPSSGSGSNKNNRPNTRDSGAVQRKSLFSVIPHLPPIYQESSDHQSDLDSLHDDLVPRSVDCDMYTSDFDERQTDSENVFNNPGELDHRCFDLVKKTNEIQRGGLGMGNAVKGIKDFESRQGKLKNKTVLGDKQNIIDMVTDHQNLSDRSSEESYSFDIKDDIDKYVSYTSESDLNTTESDLDTDRFDLGTNPSDVSLEFIETDLETEQIDLKLTPPCSLKSNYSTKFIRKENTEIVYTKVSNRQSQENLDRIGTSKRSDVETVPSVNLFEVNDDLKMDTSRLTSTPRMASTPYISLGDIDIEFESDTDTVISSRSLSAKGSIDNSLRGNQFVYKESDRSDQTTNSNQSASMEPERRIGKKDGYQLADNNPKRQVELMDGNQSVYKEPGSSIGLIDDNQSADMESGQSTQISHENQLEGGEPVEKNAKDAGKILPKHVKFKCPIDEVYNLNENLESGPKDFLNIEDKDIKIAYKPQRSRQKVERKRKGKKDKLEISIDNEDMDVQIDNSGNTLENRKNDLKDSGFIEGESNTPRLKEKSSRPKKVKKEDFHKEKRNMRIVGEKNLEEITPAMENIVNSEIERDESPKGWVDNENSLDKSICKEYKKLANNVTSQLKRRPRRKHKKQNKVSLEDYDGNIVSTSEIFEGNSFEIQKLDDTSGNNNMNEKMFSSPLLSTENKPMAEDSQTDHTSNVSSEDELINIFNLQVVHLKNDGKSTEDLQSSVKAYQKQKKQRRKVSNKPKASFLYDNELGTQNDVLSLNSEEDSDHVILLPPIQSMDSERNLRDGKTMNDGKRKKKMSKLTKKMRERKKRAETGKSHQLLNNQKVSLDVNEDNSGISHDVKDAETDKTNLEEVYKIISGPDNIGERDFNQNIGIPVEIEAALTDEEGNLLQGNNQNGLSGSPYLNQRNIKEINQLKVKSPRKQVKQSENNGAIDVLETKTDKTGDEIDRISLSSVTIESSKSREGGNILDVDEFERISLPPLKITVEVENPMSSNLRQKVVRKFSFEPLPKITEKRNSFQSQPVKKTKVKQKSFKYAQGKHYLEDNLKQTFLFDLPYEIYDRNFEEQGDVSLTDLDNQNDLDIENTTEHNLPVGDNSGNYRLQLENRPIRKGLESRPMTRERMPMFQRKPIIHENDNTQERQYDDIKSQMETATESISPSESWISKVRAANNPDDTFDLDPRRQPHSDNKDEEKSTRRNREKNQNEARYIRPENMNFRKDIDDNGQDMRQSHGSHEKQSHGSQEKQSHVVQSMSGAISPIIYETTAHPWINSGDSDREYEKANHDHYGNRKSRKQINVQLPDASMEEELVESSDVSQTSESDLELDFDDVIIEGDKGPSNMQSDKDQRNHRIERRDEDEKIDDIADEKLKDSFKMKQKMINEKLNDVSERQNGRRRRGREEDINELDEMRDENYTSSADRKERRRCRRRHMNGENLMDADIERKEYKDGSQDRKVRRHRRRRKNIDNEENDASPEFMARQAHRKGRNESKDEESLKDENGDASMERKVRRKHRIRKNDKEIRGNFNAEYDDEQKARRRRRRITVDDEEIGEGTSDNVEVGKRKDQRHSRHQRERQRRDEMAEDNDVEDEIKSRISELNDNKMKERLALYGNSDNESRRLNTSVERALLAYMNSDSETEAEDQLYEDENQIKDEDEEGNQIDEKRNFTVDDGQEALMANNFIKNISDVDASKERKNRKALKNNMDLDVLKHTNDLDDISTHDTFEKFGSMDENKDVNNKDYKWTEIKMEDEESMKPRTQLQGRKHDKFKRTKRNQKNKGNDNNADVLDKVAVSYNTDQGDKNVKDADENLADDTEESDTEILKIESYNYPNLREKDEKELYKKHERKKKSKIASKQNERKVTKKKKAKENNEEVDFNNLPSIHDTLSKLLPKNKLILLEGLKSIDEEIKGNNHHEKNNDKQLGSENNHRIFSIKSESLDRPRSASPEHLGVAFPSMLRRTSSLPSIADFVNQKIPDLEYQEFDFPQKQTTKTCPTCGDPTPEVNHVCLPKFKNRFRPKKTKDPNKKVRHGGIGVRQRKNNNTDDSDTISEMTVTTVNTQSEVQAGSQFQHVSRWPSSQAVLKGSKDTNKEPAKEMDGAERVLTPASQKISTPPDSPQLAMTPQPFRFPTPEFTVGKSGPSRPIRTPSPVVEKPKRVIQKKQFVKKEIERKPPTPIARSCTPQTPLPQVKEQETAIVTPEPEDTTPIKLPELVRLDTPPLPEITEQKRERAAKDDRRTAILPVPKLKEALKSPTQRKKKVNMPRSTHKRSRSKQAAEAPVTKEEVREMRDPLDFLAKYCIVSKDRLPFYERIYKNIIEGQPMRYDREPILSPRTGMPIDKNDGNSHGMGWDKHQLNMFHDIVTISRGRDVARPGVGVSEQYLEKISYTLEMLDKKQRQITDDLHVLQSKKLGQIAERAKQLIPEIARVQYQPKVKKSKKKKKKKKGKNLDEFGDDEDEPPSVPLRAEDITDEVIAMRLDESMYKKICKTGEIPQIDLEMQRCAEKLTGIDDRLMVLEGDKNLLSLYCMEVFFNEQNDNNQPIEFRRQQSALFRHLHPDPDIEMNIEELEGALQVVNHNLISESEFDYIYQILNLPGRRKINFQLFTVIAALSEKISQMDPVIKKILIKDNPEETKKKRRSYDALDLKMETSKELFGLLADGDYETNNNGNAKASQLAVELTAGGLDPECVGYVLSKFNRFGTGYIDFMDFVTYVPLFIEIHQKIVDDPFNVSLDIS